MYIILVYVNEPKMLNIKIKYKYKRSVVFVKNGLELANERLQIINDIQEKIDELQKVNNISDKERLERDIDVLEEKLHDNKKLLEELK